MTSTESYPIKLEPVDGVVLEIKTIQTNIHKIIADDYNDEEVTTSIVPNFNFDDANMIKMEPAVDYTLELDEDRDCGEMHKKLHIPVEDQGSKNVKSTRSKGIKRRHTEIVEEMLDVSKNESLGERIKKKVRKSTTKEAIKKIPETEILPKTLNKSNSKLQVNQENSNKKVNNSGGKEKDSRGSKTKLSQKTSGASSLDKAKLKKDGEAINRATQKSTKNNQKITKYFETTEKDKKPDKKPEIPKDLKSEEPEILKNTKQLNLKNGKSSKILERTPKTEQSSSKNPKSLQNSNKSSKTTKRSSTSNKSSLALLKSPNSRSSKLKPATKQELSSDSEHSARETCLDSQDSEDLSKFTTKSLAEPPDNQEQLSSDLTASTSLECKKCFKLFATKLKLYYHSKTHLPKDECKVCGRKIQAYLMSRHLRYHKDNKPFRCDLCPKTFISIVSIRNHMYKHTSVKKFYCDVCGRGYNDSRHLREHKLGHTNPCAYRCDMCPKGYERKQALEAHMHANHMEDTKWYTCKICGYKTKMLTVMYSHKKRHDKTIECEDCGKKFSNKSELQDHSLAIHVKVKNVECTICGKFFASKRYMLKHIRRTHADPKKFKCEICENTYKSIDALKQHLKKHESRKQKCEICKREVKESYMKKHQALNSECRKKLDQKSKNIKQDGSSNESSEDDESGE
ncbi:hypothetical protein ACKWTF_014096 [Chironomus riparius]